jgi:hypothetical protein
LQRLQPESDRWSSVPSHLTSVYLGAASRTPAEFPALDRRRSVPALASLARALDLLGSFSSDELRGSFAPYRMRRFESQELGLAL